MIRILQVQYTLILILTVRAPVLYSYCSTCREFFFSLLGCTCPGQAWVAGIGCRVCLCGVGLSSFCVWVSGFWVCTVYAFRLIFQSSAIFNPGRGCSARLVILCSKKKMQQQLRHDCSCISDDFDLAYHIRVLGRRRRGITTDCEAQATAHPKP